MSDLRTQIRVYYEATTGPVDIDAIASDVVTVGPVPDALRRRQTMTSIPPTTTRRRGPRIAWAAFAGLAAVIAGVAIAFATISSDPDAAASDPAAVIREYEAAYNARDLDRLMELFTEESVVDTGEARLEGLDQIRFEFEGRLARAADRNALEISNVEVDGSTVTWDDAVRLRSEPLDGYTYCSTGSSAVIEGGTVVSWSGRQANRSCP